VVRLGTGAGPHRRYEGLLLRDGALSQITHDHTYVQGLIDDGKLTATEAESHPQRAMLTRALTGTGDTRPDLSVHEVRPGDRYLLCSDGLSTTVTAEQMTAALGRGQGPAETVEHLVALAKKVGAPDNVACVVADVVSL
jgi:protein phosphatase